MSPVYFLQLSICVSLVSCRVHMVNQSCTSLFVLRSSLVRFKFCFMLGCFYFPFIFCTPPLSVITLYSLCFLVCLSDLLVTTLFSVLSLTSLLPWDFVLSILIFWFLNPCLPDRDYCLIPIKILISDTLCIWGPLSLLTPPQSVTGYL